MANSHRPDSKEELPPELTELCNEVDRLPWALREKVAPLCDKVCQFVLLQGRLIRIAQDAIDQLHLDNRYLLFDVEATRRERDSLRADLEDPGEES
jgi:hypothetical protein